MPKLQLCLLSLLTLHNVPLILPLDGDNQDSGGFATWTLRSHHISEIQWRADCIPQLTDESKDQPNQK